jgi:urocanate hydratase
MPPTTEDTTMKIPTTITVMINGVCLFETDVVAVIDYEIDRRYGELEWWVDEYRIEGEQSIWEKDGKTSEKKAVSFAVPKALAEVFDEHLDRDWMDDQVRGQLADMDDDRGDYLRDLAMDR